MRYILGFIELILIHKKNKIMTAMQELKQDLQESIASETEALQEIKNELIRNTCLAILERVMRNAIKRVDEEFLEIEKQQMADVSKWTLENCDIPRSGSLDQFFNEYYDSNFNHKVTQTEI